MKTRPQRILLVVVSLFGLTLLAIFSTSTLAATRFEISYPDEAARLAAVHEY